MFKQPLHGFSQQLHPFKFQLTTDKCLLLSISSPCFVIIFFFILATVAVRWNLQVVLICISRRAEDFEHILKRLFTYLKVLLHSLSQQIICLHNLTVINNGGKNVGMHLSGMHPLDMPPSCMHPSGMPIGNEPNFRIWWSHFLLCVQLEVDFLVHVIFLVLKCFWTFYFGFHISSTTLHSHHKFKRLHFSTVLAWHLSFYL